jgi:hypothetical protein
MLTGVVIRNSGCGFQGKRPAGFWSAVAALLSHSKYWTVVGYDLGKDSNWDKELVKAKAYARRKCKGGLNWVTQFTERRIHFMLDGLEMESIPRKNFTRDVRGRDHPVGKAPADMVWTSKERSTTGEELRWVYRHRNNRRVQNQIQFWKTRKTWRTIGYGKHVPEDVLSPCPPPWSDKTQTDSVRNAWAAYIPTNAP